MIALSSLIAISNIFLLTKQKDNESLILLIIISIIVFMTSKKVNIILLLLIPVIAVNLLIMTRNYMLIKLKTQKEGFDQATLNVIKKQLNDLPKDKTITYGDIIFYLNAMIDETISEGGDISGTVDSVTSGTSLTSVTDKQSQNQQSDSYVELNKN